MTLSTAGMSLGSFALGVALTAGVLGATTGAGATEDDSDTVAVARSGGVPACYDKRTGALRVLISGRCKASETRIVIGEPGPRGPQGPQGATGPAGRDGNDCPHTSTIYAPTSMYGWDRYTGKSSWGFDTSFYAATSSPSGERVCTP